MKRAYAFSLFFFVSCAYIKSNQWPADLDKESESLLSDGSMRMLYLEKCPSSALEMLNNIINFQVQKEEKADGQPVKNSDQTKENTYYSLTEEQKQFYENCKVCWSNKNSILPIDTQISSENSFLNSFSSPLKSILCAIAILKDIKDTTWFKAFFKIYPKMTNDDCREFINQNPYSAELFAQVCKIASYIYQLDSEDILLRTIARIEILEAELPPPLDKKFKQGQKKLALICANKLGDLVQNKEVIKNKNIFQSYLKQNFIDPQKFIKVIPKLKKYNNFIPKTAIQSSFNRRVINLIRQEHQIPFSQLIDICEKNKNEVIDALYTIFVLRRIRENKNAIAQDVKAGGIMAEHQSIDTQADLLLRADYQAELELWLIGTDNNLYAKEPIYRALKNTSFRTKPDFKYYFEFLDRFIQDNCQGAETSESIQSHFFHHCGILKKYIHHPFVQEHFLQFHLNSKRLHQAINYALAIDAKTESMLAKEIAQEILNNGAKFLTCLDPVIATIYEEEAYLLYQQLVKNVCEQFDHQKIVKQNRALFEKITIPYDGENGRFAAYQSAQLENFHEYFMGYEIDPELSANMQKYQVNQLLFKQMIGNRLQHQIAQELLLIMKKSLLFSSQFVHTLTEYIDLAQSYNRVGNIKAALLATDICQEMSSYLEAITLNYHENKNIYFMFCHPVQYLANIALSMKDLMNHTETYLHDPNIDLEKVSTIEDFLQNFYTKIKNCFIQISEKKQMRITDHFITDEWVTRKSCAVWGKLCSKMICAVYYYPNLTANQLLDSVSQNEKIALAALGEGLRMNVQEQKNNQINKAFEDFLGDYLKQHSAQFIRPNLKKQSNFLYIHYIKAAFLKKNLITSTKKPFAMITAEQLLDFHQRYGKKIAPHQKYLTLLHELICSESNKIRMAFGKMQPIKIKIKSIIQSFLKNKKDVITLCGMHSDYRGKIRKAGECDGTIKITKTAEKLGCYQAKVQFLDHKPYYKTFYPDDWNPNKVIAKIIEALENSTWSKKINSNEMKQCGLGYTSEGIQIKFICKKTTKGIEIISAYPSKEWILGFAQ
jgi:hypothetical protein